MDTQRVQRKIAVVLAVDVVGYSALMERDEAATFERLKQRREQIIAPEIGRFRGRIFKLMGDGVLAEFQSAVDAVECAVSIQRRMADENGDQPPDEHIVLRVGIDLGDVIVEGDDLYGEGVNTAARIEQLCEPGGISISRAIHDQVQNKLDFPFDSIGLQSLKNISQPKEVFRVGTGASAKRARSVVRPQGKAWRMPVIGAVGALLLAGIAIAFWQFFPARNPSSLQSDRGSIAVLPSKALGGGEQWQRFTEGLTNDIISDLARFRHLTVIARNSTEIYRGKVADVREIGRDLSVDYVLDGSLQTSGEQLRVTAQLIDATNGALVWSDRFDRPQADLFDVQNEITANIVALLGGWQKGVSEAGLSAARRKDPANLEAYDYYLLAGAEHAKITKEGAEAARALYMKALEIDPYFQPAIIGIGTTYANQLDSGTADNVEEAKAKYAEFIRRAYELDPDDPPALIHLAFVHNYYGEFDKAVEPFHKAIENAANDTSVLMMAAGNACFLGEPELGPELAKRALRLDPHHLYWWNFMLRWAYFFARDFENASIATARIGSAAANDQAYVAMIAAQLGRIQDAKNAAAKVLSTDPDWSVELYVSSIGGFRREAEVNLLAESARKSELPVCMSALQLAKHPESKRMKTCDIERQVGRGG